MTAGKTGELPVLDLSPSLKPREPDNFALVVVSGKGGSLALRQSTFKAHGLEVDTGSTCAPAQTGRVVVCNQFESGAVK